MLSEEITNRECIPFVGLTVVDIIVVLSSATDAIQFIPYCYSVHLIKPKKSNWFRLLHLSLPTDNIDCSSLLNNTILNNALHND